MDPKGMGPRRSKAQVLEPGLEPFTWSCWSMASFWMNGRPLGSDKQMGEGREKIEIFQGGSEFKQEKWRFQWDLTKQNSD